MNFIRVSYIFLLLIVVGCSLVISNKKETRVLMIGNSYTAISMYKDGKEIELNNVPKIANILLGEKYHVDFCIHGGYSIKKHVKTELCKTKLQNENWDLVILQERTKNILRDLNGSVESILTLKSWNSSPTYILFQNWARLNQKDEHYKLRIKYEKMVNALKLDLIRVGNEWKSIMKDFPLYSSDQSHGNSFGILLTALAVVDKIDQNVMIKYSSKLENALRSIEENQKKFGDVFKQKVNQNSITDLIKLYIKKRNKQKIRFHNTGEALLKVVERGDPSKRPIILLHGGPGHPGYMWSLAKNLKNQFTVEYFQRDVSNSTSKGSFTVKDHVDDLDNLVSSFSQSPILIGHSWGATLATEYLKVNSGKVKKVILISPGTLTIEMSKKFAENIYKSAGKDEAKARRLYKKLSSITDKNEYKKLFPKYFSLIKNAYCYNCKKFPHNKMIMNPVTILNTENDQVAKRETDKDYWEQVKNSKISTALSAIKDRVIHIQPEFDVNPAKDLVKILRGGIKNYKLYKIKNTGHFPWLEPQSKLETLKIIQSEI